MRYLLTVALLTLFSVLTAQNQPRWKGYFSYNEVRDFSQSPGRLYAGSQNALFTYNNSTSEVRTYNTIDGLPSEDLTAIYHSAATNKTLIGYETGLMVVLNENDGTVLRVVDIINKQIPPNIKKINQFTEVDGMLYISCDFGVVQYNLSTLQFGDTYFLGAVTSELVVHQTAALDGFIYAATQTEGIRRGDLSNPNLIDASQWQQLNTGNYAGIAEFEGNLFALSVTGQVLRSINGLSFFPFGPTLSLPVKDIRTGGGYLIITSINAVYVYDEDLILMRVIRNTDFAETNIVFNCATVVGSDIFAGTQTEGVIRIPITNPTAYHYLTPDGPLRNNIFSINAESSNLWAVYGGYTYNFDPNPLIFMGASKYNSETGWKYIPFNELGSAPNLVRVTVNPSNENKVFISSYSGGLLELENDVLIKHHIQNNSGLQSLGGTAYTDIRVEQSAYDKNGNLWLSNGLMTDAIRVLRSNGSWNSYEIADYVTDYFDSRFGRLSIDKNGTKWFSTLSDGVVGFNENAPTPVRVLSKDGNGNLPTNRVQVTAVDKRNQLWIGTSDGLRVLSGVDRFMNDGQPLSANPIIITEEGLGQELMSDQFITDIVVDGGNNKWIGTLDAGVFHVSGNGQETLHIFNSSNSPLPSNTINDIDINPATGEVFFATSKGMVSFRGDAISASDDLANVIVYPNPVRPGFIGTVKISGLTDRATVKITDIEGSLVYEAISQGGTVEWDTTAFGRYRVASGVYMIFISAEDGLETKVKKVMIVR
jgi:hypothetical protein